MDVYIVFGGLGGYFCFIMGGRMFVLGVCWVMCQKRKKCSQESLRTSSGG